MQSYHRRGITGLLDAVGRGPLRSVEHDAAGALIKAVVEQIQAVL